MIVSTETGLVEMALAVHVTQLGMPCDTARVRHVTQLGYIM